MRRFPHDTKLVSLECFGKLDYTALKWSTAGDFMVNDGGKKVVVNGKSAMRRCAPPRASTATCAPTGHHQHPLHARPAVLAGQKKFKHRSRQGSSPPK